MKLNVILSAAVMAAPSVAEPVPSEKKHLFNSRCLPVQDSMHDLKKSNGQLATASAYCSSLLLNTTTVTSTVTAIQTNITVATSNLTATQTTTLAAPAPTATEVVNADCNIMGYDKGIPAYNYDGSGTSANFETCHARCLADTNCLSFAFGEGACLLYDYPVQNNVNVVDSSPYAFFDRNCSEPVVASGKVKRAVSPEPPVILQGVHKEWAIQVCSCLIEPANTTTSTLVK